jgi:hypothetical protein
MKGHSEARGAFAERYAIESFPDGGGVLVDLHTGGYFKLNATAVAVCAALGRGGTIDDAITELGKQMRIPPAEARDLVELVSKGLSTEAAREEVFGTLTYESRSDGSSLLLEDGRPIFRVDGARSSLRFCATSKDLKVPIYFYLRSLMPKLLALLGVPVLHASACSVGDALLAFSGKSEAGKTTTALAFERAGYKLVSEDLLVLSLAGESPEVFVDGEPFARGWARAQAAVLETTPDNEIEFTALLAAPRGQTLRLDAVWFLAAARRRGDQIGLRSLSAGDGVLALLGSGFLAASTAQHWRDFLRRSRFIAERTALFEATMPSGLAQLESAARAYIVNSAS